MVAGLSKVLARSRETEYIGNHSGLGKSWHYTFSLDWSRLQQKNCQDWLPGSKSEGGVLIPLAHMAIKIRGW